MQSYVKPFFLLLFFFSASLLFAAKIPAYYKVNGTSGSMSELTSKVKNALSTGSFKVIGEYNPTGNAEMKVIAFTHSGLTNIAVQFKDRGALGSILKAAIRKNGSSYEVSFVNPEYMFNAYFQEAISDKKSSLLAINEQVKAALKGLGTGLTAFGGELEADKLQEYQYMWGMPEFTDPVKLNEYSSFEDGLKIIRKKLEAKTGNTVLVYEHYIPGSKVAVFGVGLLDSKEGEDHFLSIIGEGHIAAMPYEIILQDKKATMLHGRFRFALYWPELTMGTFTKIMSTPGDVEDFLKALTKE